MSMNAMSELQPPTMSPAKPLTLTWQRWGALLLALIGVACIGASLVRYPPLFAEPGALRYVSEAVAALAVYSALCVWVPAVVGPRGGEALRIGTWAGVAAGVLWILNHWLEVFTNLGSQFGAMATLPFFLAGFALWGVAGGLAGRSTRSVRRGVLAAIWSAMLCALLVTTFGLVVTHIATPRLEQQLAADPDFQRSRWSSLHAFAFANSFDAAFWHLVEAPIIAAGVGGISSVLATPRPPRESQGIGVRDET